MSSLERLEQPEGYNTDSMSYYLLEDKRPRDEDIAEIVGASVGAEVGFNPNGPKVYIKDAEGIEDDAVQSHIAAGIYFNHLRSVTPEIAYDDVYGKIMIEQMPGEFTDDYDELHERYFHRAVAEKLLLGDVDYAGNFLATNYDVVPIDFDMTGRDLETAKKVIERWPEASVDEETLYQEARRIAEDIDIQELENDLKDEKMLMNSWSTRDTVRDAEPMEGLFHGSIDNILENVRRFQGQSK